MWKVRFLQRLQHFVHNVNGSCNLRFGAAFPRSVFSERCYTAGENRLVSPTPATHSNGKTNSTFPRIITLAAALSWPFGKAKDTDEVEAKTKELFTDAIRCAWASDFVRAERVLNRLLRHLLAANTKHLLKDEEYVHQRARVCAELANVNLALGKLSEAEKLLKQAIRNVATAGVPLTDPMVVEMSLKLALVYQKMSRPEEASSGFLYCIETEEKKLTSGDVKDPEQLINEQALLGMCHNYYSKFLFETRKSEEALHHARKALELADKLYEEDHFNCLHLLCDVAVILVDLNQFSSARSSLGRAEKLVRAKLEKETLDAEGLRSCLAHILLQRIALEAQDGQLVEAKTYAKEVKKIASLLAAPRTVLNQLTDYRKRYKLDVQ